MQWYYEGPDGQGDPVSEEEFNSLIRNGTIKYSTLVWNSTMTDWKEYGRLNISSEGSGSSNKSFCIECGRSYFIDDMIKYGDSWVCAQCKPVFIQKIKEGVTVTQMDYAGFWIRVGASIIDYIILLVVCTIISIPLLILGGGFSTPTDPSLSIFFTLVNYLLNFIIKASYATFFIGKWGATPGKMACGLKVVTPDGERITYLRAFARYLAKILNYFTLGVGYIIVAFDDEKRGLHDRICSTRVVRN